MLDALGASLARCSMNAPPAEVHAGQAIYNRFVLAIYDVVVLGISNRYIWQCPTRRLLAHYDQH